MWPFNKKNTDTDTDTEPKSNLTQEAIDDLKSFRDIGEKFNYMGIEMIVKSHYYLIPHPFAIIPRILAVYADKHGVLRHTTFIRRELTELRAEN